METGKDIKLHDTGIELVIGIFQSLAQFTLYHSIACLIAGIGREETHGIYLRMGILLVPLLVYLLTRMYVGNLFWFTLLHIGAAWGLVFFFPKTAGERLAMVLCLLVMLVNSIRFRITKSYPYQECPSLMMTACLVIVSVLAAYAEKVLLIRWCFYEWMVFLLFYMVSKNLENMERFIYLNRDTANFPIRQMKWVNRTLLSFFTVVMLGGMLLSPLLHPENIAVQIKHLLIRFLRWFFSLFSGNEIRQESIQRGMENSDPGFGFLMEEAVPSKIALFFQYLLEIATTLFLIAAVLFGIGFGLYQIYKRFYEMPLKEEEKKQKMDVITTTERIPIFRKKKETQEEWGGNRKKIRRQYKKSVIRRKGKMQILAPSLTPTEIEAVLEGSLAKETDPKRVIDLYEKARYGKEECTKEEWEEVRKIL